jgi:hypothetical protein
MNFYLNYFKQKIMATEGNPPVGVILCSDKDQTKVQFATAGLDNQLFVSRYLRVAFYVEGESVVTIDIGSHDIYR